MATLTSSPAPVTADPAPWLHRLRELMQQALDDETLFKEWFGTMISEAKHDLDVSPMEPDYGADEVADLLSQGEPPSRCLACAPSGSAVRPGPATSTARPGPCRARMPPPSPCSATRTWSPRTTWRSSPTRPAS